MKSVSRWTVWVFIKIRDGVSVMNWKGTNYVNPCRIVISEKKMIKWCLWEKMLDDQVLFDRNLLGPTMCKIRGMDPGGNWEFKERGGAYEVYMKMNSLNFY